MRDFSEWLNNRIQFDEVATDGLLTGGGATSDDAAASLSSLGESAASNVPYAAITNAARSVFDMVASATGKEQNDTMDTIYDTASQTASLFGPWGALAAGVIDTWNFIDKMAGKKTEGFDGNTGMSGYLNYTVEDHQFRLTQGNAWKEREKYKEALLNQFSKAMKNVNSAKLQNTAAVLATDNFAENARKKLNGGVGTEALVAKLGSKLDFMHTYLLLRNSGKLAELQKAKESEDILKFQYGGSLAVIPSGSLHKNKHHLTDENPELKGNITEKGIPVITDDEHGIILHAEIELEEVILALPLTKLLEKLWKEDTDESAIEAGKLLANALLHDVEDNTGLIQKMTDNESKS